MGKGVGILIGCCFSRSLEHSTLPILTQLLHSVGATNNGCILDNVGYVYAMTERMKQQRQQEEQGRGATLSASAMHSKLQRLIYDNVICLGVSNGLDAVLNKSIVKVPSVQQAKQQQPQQVAA
eukprot:scaffold11596_cov79-Skeletonema_dohrnii-CCMP3373.AAC.1